MIAWSDTWKANLRFGLGPRPGETAPIAGDPRGYVRAQLDIADPMIPVPEVLTTEAIRREFLGRRREQTRARSMVKLIGAETAPQDLHEAVEELRKAYVEFRTGTYRDETEMRAAKALSTGEPFVERLVMFWANHFAVAAGGLIRVFAGVHERETIRPHVTGRFAGMLRAAVLHPAMLSYLNNDKSIGPDSPLARRRRRRKTDINENLARELLELHTLGVDGGYTQADVIELAYALTGWTGGLSPRTEGDFAPERHQPGTRTILGRRYGEAGERQIHAILDDLARHPATARHVATKIASHFVSDDAPSVLVDRLEHTFRETDGDLAAVSRALVEADEAWAPAPAKIVPPYDFVVSVARATQQPLDGQFLAQSLHSLGQMAWSPPSPAGWPGGDSSWVGGDALMERLDWLEQFTARTPLGDAHPADVAAELLGADLDAHLETALKRAESREQAYALLFMSPYWLRR
jgi:uncharacterized protein (DUF1800 family)